MKIPDYVTIYDKGKKLKIGSKCPKHLEDELQKVIAAKTAQAQKLGEHFAPHSDEEKIIEKCSRYPEFNEMVLQAYKDARKVKPKKEEK